MSLFELVVESTAAASSKIKSMVPLVFAGGITRPRSRLAMKMRVVSVMTAVPFIAGLVIAGLSQGTQLEAWFEFDIQIRYMPE
jgi:NhaP-type Na+/H+ or K+/H+ antiporter